MTNPAIEQNLEAMIEFAINFAYEHYLLPNAVEGGNISNAIPYFKEHGFPEKNIYDTPEIRSVVGQIITESFATGTPYENREDAGQIILAGAIGSAPRLRTILDEGKFPDADAQQKYDAAKIHSVKSDFDLFKSAIAANDIHGYSAEAHTETFSRIRGLCSGLDNAIQAFAPKLGYGVIVDNTLAPVSNEQQEAFIKGFSETCRLVKVRVIGLALTPEEAIIQNPEGAATAKAFAEQAKFIQENAGDLVIVNNELQVIYHHANGIIGDSYADMDAVIAWKRSNEVAPSFGRQISYPPRFAPSQGDGFEGIRKREIASNRTQVSEVNSLGR